MTSPSEHAATVREALPIVNRTPPTEDGFDYYVGCTPQECERIEASHASLDALAALAARADELERENAEWNPMYGRLYTKLRDAEARADELAREIEELRGRWQDDVERMGREVNERQQRADENRMQP